MLLELPFFAVFIPKEGGGPWKLGNLLTSIPDNALLRKRTMHGSKEVPRHSLARLERRACVLRAAKRRSADDFG